MNYSSDFFQRGEDFRRRRDARFRLIRTLAWIVMGVATLMMVCGVILAAVMIFLYGPAILDAFLRFLNSLGR